MNELALKYGCNPNQKPSRIYMADGSDLRADELTASHADWAEAFAKNYTITKDNAMEIVQKETGLVFAKVLEHAGVYKRTPEGKEAFLRFIEQI